MSDHSNKAVHRKADSDKAGGDNIIVRDPVCGMTVDTAANKPSTHYNGHDFHFCCQSCHDKFVATPTDYIEAEDPVCGMKVERASAKHLHKHQGERFYFCSSGCR